MAARDKCWASTLLSLSGCRTLSAPSGLCGGFGPSGHILGIRRQLARAITGDQISGNLRNKSLTDFLVKFSQPFQSLPDSDPVSPISACYTGISRNQCTIPSLPSPPSPRPFGAALAAVAAAGRQPTLMLFSSSAPWPPSCDASCKKVPPDASQNLDPGTQPIEKEALKTS